MLRMKGMVGIHLSLGKAIIEARVRLDSLHRGLAIPNRQSTIGIWVWPSCPLLAFILVSKRSHCRHSAGAKKHAKS